MCGIIPRMTKTQIGFLKMWTLKTMCFIAVFVTLSVIAQNAMYFFMRCVSKFILKIFATVANKYLYCHYLFM